MNRPTADGLHKLLIRADARCASWGYATVPYRTLAAAAGVDERTWRRWRTSPPDLDGSRADHVRAILAGWLVLTEHAARNGTVALLEVERVRAWRRDPSRLALSCLVALHPSASQLELVG